MKVLLIDDHPLILSAMQSVILGLDEAVEAVGVETVAECRELLQTRSDFDLVLLDLQLGEDSGFDLLAHLREAYPALPVVIVSASDRASDIIRAIDAGAMGFVPKRASNELLFEALHKVMSGSIYVPPMSLNLGDTVTPLRSAPPLDERTAYAGGTPLLRGAPPGAPKSIEQLALTPRQREVLQLLLHGKSNKMIARDLDISVETVKDHVAAVLRSLNVNSRTQAVLAVSQMGQSTRPGLQLSPLRATRF